jgi:hypothetical protein
LNLKRKETTNHTFLLPQSKLPRKQQTNKKYFQILFVGIPILVGIFF